MVISKISYYNATLTMSLSKPNSNLSSTSSNMSQVGQNTQLDDEFSEKFLSFALSFHHKLGTFEFWKLLSKNKNITMNTVKRHPEYPWNFNSMSENRNLTAEFVVENQTKDWNWEYVCGSIKNVGYVYKHVSNLRFSWKGLEKNEKCTQEDAEIIGYRFWKMHTPVFYLSDCSIEFVMENIEKFRSLYCLSKTMPVNDIEQHPELKWNWDVVSWNPTVTQEFIIKHHTKKWDWHILGYKGHYDMNLVRALYNTSVRNKMMEGASEYIPIDEINKNKHLEWNYNKMSRNETITSIFVEANINKNWDWVALGSRLDIDFIDRHCTKHKKLLTYVCDNPHITHAFFVKRIGIKRAPSHNEVMNDINQRYMDGMMSSADDQFGATSQMFAFIGMSNNASLEDIEQHPDFNWHYSCIIERNPNFNIDFAKRMLPKDYGWYNAFGWNKAWDYVSESSRITMQNILDNPDYPWNYKKILDNRYCEYKKLFLQNPTDFVLPLPNKSSTENIISYVKMSIAKIFY